jgi:hypothetical protein
MKTKFHFIIVLILPVLFISYACNFAPGSYPYAEKYKLKIKESELIIAIKRFKEDNSGYCVPPQIQLFDGKSKDIDDHWYHVYFYYQEENQIIYTWIRQFDKETTYFAFVAVNDGLRLGNWKMINKDFSRKENKLQKEKFEQRILNEIKKQIEK